MAGLLSGLMSKMKLNDSEYLSEFEDDFDEEPEEEVRKKTSRKKTVKTSSKKSYASDYDDIDEEEDRRSVYHSKNRRDVSAPASHNRGRKIVSMNRNNYSSSHSDNSMEVRVHRPIDVNSAEDICMDLMDGKAVLINFITVDEAVMQRIVDIVSGATLAIDGKVRLISDMIAVFAPKDIDITGNFDGYTTGRIGVPSLGSHDYDEEEEL